MGKRQRILLIGMPALALVALAWVRVRTLPAERLPERVQAPLLREFSASPPNEPIDLLFMHHRVGAQLLAESGEGSGRDPKGGGARLLLEQSGYRVHTATFGSRFGANNSLFDWLPKFRDHLDELLHIDKQDSVLIAPRCNRIVMFKSCFDNSRFVGEGTEPGDPKGPTLTLANAKATFRQLLPVLASHPEVLFVYVTTPPLALPRPERLGAVMLKRVLGRPTYDEETYATATMARKFHDWSVSPDGWLGHQGPRNVAIFDLYDYLTKQSSSPFLEYPSGDKTDSHPDAQATKEAARLLVPWLNRAVRRAKLDEARPAPESG